MTAALIISTYNWPEALERVLSSALAQTTPPDEIIVADDGSSEDTSKVIERARASTTIPIHHVAARRGFQLSRIRNAAVARSECDYIISIDGDMVLHPDFIADHKRTAKPGFFVQGVRLLAGDDASKKLMSNTEYDMAIFTPDVERRRHAVRMPYVSKIIASKPSTSTRGIRGCNMAFWKTDLLKINGWNERIVGWGLEDDELVARLFSAGIQRLDLRFGGLATHLHHPQRPAERPPERSPSSKKHGPKS